MIVCHYHQIVYTNLLASPPAEPLSVHQEVQQVETTVVAEGEESLGQGQGSSDSDDCLTPSPPPTKRVSSVPSKCSPECF